MRDPWNDSELARRFAAHARTSATRAPLHSALAGIVSRRPALSGLLAHAPETRRLPVLLLAAIHFLVLDEAEHPLASWFPDLCETPRSPDDPELAPTVVDFVERRAPAVLELVASRQVQTNEVGRCALLVPAFSLVAAGTGPIAQVDVGSSAGLTLLWPRFSYRFDGGRTVGSRGSVRPSVVLDCATRGDAPLDLDTLVLPDAPVRVGIDIDPIDVSDPVEARWLQACCWPDQADRLARLRSAVDLAREDPPTVRRGDAVETVADVVDGVEGDLHPVVTTTWALNYLPATRRTEFVAVLDRLGARRDLSWVFAESPALTPGLPHATSHADGDLTALALVTWRDGVRSVTHLGVAHPHGYWIHWSGSSEAQPSDSSDSVAARRSANRTEPNSGS